MSMMRSQVCCPPLPRITSHTDLLFLGRITLNGALGDSETAGGRSKRRLSSAAGRYSSRTAKLAPEEALFKRRNAPVRYAEHDIYWANEDLPDAGRHHLPDGSLLKSVHGYASRFYAATAARLGPRCTVGRRIVDEKSMDETAMLAFGILLEEAARDALGKRGDLVFTEPSTEPKAVSKPMRVAEFSGAIPQGHHGEGEVPTLKHVRKAKRRKGAKDESLETQASF